MKPWSWPWLELEPPVFLGPLYLPSSVTVHVVWVTHTMGCLLLALCTRFRPLKEVTDMVVGVPACKSPSFRGSPGADRALSFLVFCHVSFSWETQTNVRSSQRANQAMLEPKSNLVNQRVCRASLQMRGYQVVGYTKSAQHQSFTHPSPDAASSSFPVI